jgi:hypothetical protein
MDFSPSFQDHKRPELGRYIASKHDGHQLPENVKIGAHCFGNVCKLALCNIVKKLRHQLDKSRKFFSSKYYLIVIISHLILTQ